MRKGEKFQKEKIGRPGYINENCWLVKTINYPPAEHCQYCELEFRDCLFSRYLIISLILISFLLALSFLIEGNISKLVIISIFVLVIIYGYFFNKSAEKIIKANFAEREAKKSLEKLAEGLEDQVEEKTKKLKGAYEELKVLDKAKSDFISIASHQLRTPLTAIKGYISMILEGDFGKLTKKEVDSLKKVFVSNERLIRLVENLLNISRIESGRLQFNFAEVQLENMIDSVVGELAFHAKEKGLKLIYKKDEKTPPPVKIDEEKIRQVVMNLIDNAIKYSQKGSILVSLKYVENRQETPSDAKERQNNYIEFCVADSGMGISKDDLPRLFQKFTRGSGTSLVHTEGTGLGLYVARMMIEAHNGKIWAESEGEGKGSKFCFKLPENT